MSHATPWPSPQSYCPLLGALSSGHHSCVPACAAFQQLEVDYYIGTPNQQVFRTDLLETPIIRMYGVTEHGAVP